MAFSCWNHNDINLGKKAIISWGHIYCTLWLMWASWIQYHPRFEQRFIREDPDPCNLLPELENVQLFTYTCLCELKIKGKYWYSLNETVKIWHSLVVLQQRHPDLPNLINLPTSHWPLWSPAQHSTRCLMTECPAARPHQFLQNECTVAIQNFIHIHKHKRKSALGVAVTLFNSKIMSVAFFSTMYMCILRWLKSQLNRLNRSWNDNFTVCYEKQLSMQCKHIQDRTNHW